MSPRAVARIRTAVVLLVLVGLVLAAVAYGYRSLTKPLPGTTTALCTDADLATGDLLYPDQVVVSVLNAGERSGLASRTMTSLTERGFARGSVADAPRGADVSKVQIWTDDPKNPAVRLVQANLGRKNTEVVRRDPVTEGIDVVVGDGFGKLARNRKRIKVRDATTVCGPNGGVVPSEEPSAAG